MRTMPCVFLAFLLGDGDRVGENSDLLIITASGNHRVTGAQANVVQLAIVDILVNLLNWESEFTRPSCPFTVLEDIPGGRGRDGPSFSTDKFQLICLRNNSQY